MNKDCLPVDQYCRHGATPALCAVVPKPTRATSQVIATADTHRQRRRRRGVPIPLVRLDPIAHGRWPAVDLRRLHNLSGPGADGRPLYARLCRPDARLWLDEH